MTEAPILVSGWERVARHMDELRERLRRAIAALTAAGVPYAVVGGNAVAEWVGRADPAGVRNTKDVDILLRRSDLDAATAAWADAGFIHRHVAGRDIFLDGQRGKAREAVHIVFANESLRDDANTPAPDVTESEPGVGFQVLRLDSLVRMKLVANRDKDRTHLRDLIDVGLIDATWPAGNAWTLRRANCDDRCRADRRDVARPPPDGPRGPTASKQSWTCPTAKASG